MTDISWCKNCVFIGFIGSDRCCDYILITGHSRGCPAGRECTQKVVGKKRKSIDQKMFRGERKQPIRKRKPADKKPVCGGAQRAIIEGFMKENGFTNSDMGTRLGVDPTTVGKWKLERYIANWDLLEREFGLKRPEGVNGNGRKRKASAENSGSNPDGAK